MFEFQLYGCEAKSFHESVQWLGVVDRDVVLIAIATTFEVLVVVKAGLRECFNSPVVSDGVGCIGFFEELAKVVDCETIPDVYEHLEHLLRVVKLLQGFGTGR